jgi:hypothetical protein
MWGFVAAIVAAAIRENLKGNADRAERWHEECRRVAQEFAKKQAAKAAYEKERQMERKRFYSGQLRIKPDGWKPENSNLTALERSDHERLMDWKGW